MDGVVTVVMMLEVVVEWAKTRMRCAVAKAVVCVELTALGRGQTKAGGDISMELRAEVKGRWIQQEWSRCVTKRA